VRLQNSQQVQVTGKKKIEILSWQVRQYHKVPLLRYSS